MDCRLVNCRLVDCRMVDCRLVDCRMVDCRMVDCRMVDCRLVDRCTPSVYADRSKRGSLCAWSFETRIPLCVILRNANPSRPTWPSEAQKTH